MSDRMAALVAALLGVRTDHASARFDAEIDAALAANALDVQTARALRFWQRASVQEVEDSTAGVLPLALAARGDADRQGLVARRWTSSPVCQRNRTVRAGGIAHAQCAGRRISPFRRKGQRSCPLYDFCLNSRTPCARYRASGPPVS